MPETPNQSTFPTAMTLVELARELNVSIATISRALNHPED
ncbi:MAG: LacI family DNA-binding transcriptional regulator, partial [Verrucomicrobia bacterium]|nr:LacI family DNA-binding transcriptional regulator [Verrucomicrobiota bacterium]